MISFSKIKSLLSGAVGFLILLTATVAFGLQQSAAITGLKIYPDRNEIEITTKGEIEYGYFPLSDPDRLVFDFPNTLMAVDGGYTVTRKVKGDYFHEVRLSSFAQEPPAARLVVYLSRPAGAKVEYTPSDKRMIIRVQQEEKYSISKLTSSGNQDSIASLKSLLEKNHGSSKPVYDIKKTENEVLIRLGNIDPGNVTVRQLRFPDRLDIRMYGSGKPSDGSIRFEPLERGKIWNQVAKQWVSFVGRTDESIINLVIYLHPKVTYKQEINSDGYPEIRILKSSQNSNSLTEEYKESQINADEAPEAGESGEVVIYSSDLNKDSQSIDNDIVKKSVKDDIDVVKPVEKIDRESLFQVPEIVKQDGETVKVEKDSDNKETESEVKAEESKPDSQKASPPSKSKKAYVESGASLLDDNKKAKEVSALNMKIGDVEVIHVKDLVRASIGNPAVATLNVISKNELLVTALASGTTTLLTWENERGHVARQVNVVDATGPLEENISSIINDPNIKVSIIMAGGMPAVVLEGVVKTEEERTRAESIASLYVGKDRVTNLLEMTNPRQVMVKVRVVEIDRRELDSRLSHMSGSLRTDNNDFSFGIITDLFDPENPGGGLMDTRVKPGIVNGNAKDVIFDPIDAMLNALKTNRKARVLSEPNVIALSNHQAHFRVGGEVPYTYQNENGFNVVDFKEFGIQLDMLPKIDSMGNIKLKVEPKISTIDKALAIAGIPGFRTREMSTEVQLKEGETLVIGGLIQHEITEIVSKVPLLSEIPILGQLFKSKSFANDETELVVFLTPFIIDEPSKAHAAVGINLLQNGESE